LLLRIPQASTGRAPGRADKEALRPLYVRYWRLKRALAAATGGAGGGCSTGGAAASAARPAMIIAA